MVKIPLIDDARSALHLDGVDDAGTTQRLTMLLHQGQAYLNGLMGGVLDFEEDFEAHALLMAYVRYAYHDATELYLENFYDDVFRKQLKFATEGMMAVANQSTTTSGSANPAQSVG